MKKAKENWIGEKCNEIVENRRKKNSKSAVKDLTTVKQGKATVKDLTTVKQGKATVKDLTTVKQGKATTVQDCSGKCFTEEQEILN